MKFQVIERIYKSFPNEWIGSEILNKITGDSALSKEVRRSQMIEKHSESPMIRSRGTLKNLYLDCLSWRYSETYPSYLRYYNVLRIIRLCEPIQRRDLLFLVEKENIFQKRSNNYDYIISAIKRFITEGHVISSGKERMFNRYTITPKGLEALKHVDNIIYKCDLANE